MSLLDVTPEQRLRGAAALGLEDGDLRPLAALIRAGVPIEGALAAAIADAIDGCGRVRLSAVKQKNRPTLSQEFEIHDRKIDIGIFVERRARSAKSGEYESIVREAMQKWQVGRTTVTNAHKWIRTCLAADIDNSPYSTLEDMIALADQMRVRSELEGWDMDRWVARRLSSANRLALDRKA